MMKAITWLASFTVGAAVISPATAFASAPEGWSSNLEKAFAQAKARNKSILVEFTGSDWCPPCIMMRKEVFSKKQFVETASKKFILVELDFPNSDPAMKEKNTPYIEKYRVDGFPTVILFNPQGKEFTRFTANEYTNPDSFLQHLNEALEKKNMD